MKVRLSLCRNSRKQRGANDFTQREYADYVNLAQQHGMKVAVVEVFCPDGGRGGRSVHTVPTAVIGRMRSRFERDDAAVRLISWSMVD